MPSLLARAPRAAVLAVLATLVALLLWPGAAGADIGLPADLQAGISSSASPLNGQPLVYTITAKNNGPGNEGTVQLTQTLPTTAAYTSSDSGCTPGTNAGTVTCMKSGLPNGETATFHVTVTPSQAGDISSQVNVSGDAIDDQPMNDSATDNTTVAPAADLSITKTHSPPQAFRGENLDYTLTATNAGPDPAASVVVTDPLPAGVDLVAPLPDGCMSATTQGVTTVTCSEPSLAKDTSKAFVITVKPNQSGPLSNTASVSSSTADPTATPAANSATDDTTVQQKADLSVSIAHTPDHPRLNQNVTYVVGVENKGPYAAEGVKITDVLPTGLTFSSGSAGCTNDDPTAGTVTCRESALGSSGKTFFTIIAKATQTGPVTNTATVTSSTIDATSANDSASETVDVEARVDLSLTLTHTPSAPVAGSAVTYTLTVGNAVGSDPAENVKITDPLPSGTSFVTADAGCVLSADKVTCTQGTLGAGASATFHVTLKPTNGGTLRNAAATSTTSTDTDASNDSATDSVTVSPAPTPLAPASADLGIRVSRDAPRLVRGVEAIYTLGAVNHGPSTASGVSITATLPSNVTYVSATSGCKRSGVKVTCPVGSLASGARASRAIRVRPNRTGTTSTRATISSSVHDPDTSDNTDADTAYVEEPSASRGRLIVCRVGHSGSVCTVRYDGKGRPKVTGSLRRGTHTYASGGTRNGRPLRLNSRHRISEGKYTLVRTYNGRRITFDAVYVVVVR